MPPVKKLDRFSVTATDVRIAIECPRLFYLKQRFGGKTLFIPQTSDQSTFAIGNPFHSLAQNCVKFTLQDSRFRSLLSPSEHSIKRLGAMARAAGIHLIIATQRPEARVVTPIIRSNLPGRVALRTATEADSIIILDSHHKQAAYLLGKGDLLYKGGSQVQRLQSLFASTPKF